VLCAACVHNSYLKKTQRCSSQEPARCWQLAGLGLLVHPVNDLSQQGARPSLHGSLVGRIQRFCRVISPMLMSPRHDHTSTKYTASGLINVRICSCSYSHYLRTLHLTYAILHCEDYVNETCYICRARFCLRLEISGLKILCNCGYTLMDELRLGLSPP